MELGSIVEVASAAIHKYELDPAAYEDDLLHSLIENGWSFCGVEEGLFEAMTPNGIKIGPMTPDEVFWAEQGYRAAQRKA